MSKIKLFWFFYGLQRLFNNSRYWSFIKAWDTVVLKRKAYLYKEARYEQDKDD